MHYLFCTNNSKEGKLAIAIEYIESFEPVSSDGEELCKVTMISGKEYTLNGAYDEVVELFREITNSPNSAFDSNVPIRGKLNTEAYDKGFKEWYQQPARQASGYVEVTTHTRVD